MAVRKGPETDSESAGFRVADARLGGFSCDLRTAAAVACSQRRREMLEMGETSNDAARVNVTDVKAGGIRYLCMCDGQ